jgi:hypothetical protein
VTTETLARAVRDGIARTVAVIGLAGVALIHLLDLPGKFDETPYVAWMYIGLIAGCLVTAFALARSRNWTEPLGLASLFVEGSLVALAVAMLTSLSGLRRFALVEARP